MAHRAIRCYSAAASLSERTSTSAHHATRYPSSLRGTAAHHPGDAMEAIACRWLSFVVVITLTL